MKVQNISIHGSKVILSTRKRDTRTNQKSWGHNENGGE